MARKDRRKNNKYW